MLVAIKTYALELMILHATPSNPQSHLSHYSFGLAGKVPIVSFISPLIIHQNSQRTLKSCNLDSNMRGTEILTYEDELASLIIMVTLMAPHMAYTVETYRFMVLAKHVTGTLYNGNIFHQFLPPISFGFAPTLCFALLVPIGS